MCQALLSDRKFYEHLFRVDRDLADQVRAGGCLRCGERLHSARYPRKPRGGAWKLSPDEEMRFSFCCAACRKRRMPGSVRFLGRRVYLGMVVVLASAMSSGLTDRRVAKLREHIDVDRRTLERWRTWWQETFVSTELWIEVRGRLRSPVNESELPWSLFELFGGGMRENLVAMLRFLSPLGSSR
ncbi:MAG: hypothetical protein ACE5G2_12145 [Candidatus Krumholzibacteriia bacterium]